MNSFISKIKKVKIVFLILAILNIVYILLCDIFAYFSISMNVLFLVFAFLNFLIYLILCRKFDYSTNSPNFAIIFIQILYVALNLVFIFLLLINITYKKNTLSNIEEYDYIVVFGAGVKADENRNFIINSRLNKALEYAKVNKKAVFILTGAKVEDSPIEEAMYMKNYLISNGINLDRIMTDIKSINTYQNLHNAFDLIENDILRRNRIEGLISIPFDTSDELFDLDEVKVGLMSSDFHLTRIVMISKKLGVSNAYVISANTNVLYKPYCYMRESLSIFKAFVLGELKY